MQQIRELRHLLQRQEVQLASLGAARAAAAARGLCVQQARQHHQCMPHDLNMLPSQHFLLQDCLGGCRTVTISRVEKHAWMDSPSTTAAVTLSRVSSLSCFFCVKTETTAAFDVSSVGEPVQHSGDCRAPAGLLRQAPSTPGWNRPVCSLLRLSSARCSVGVRSGSRSEC